MRHEAKPRKILAFAAGGVATGGTKLNSVAVAGHDLSGLFSLPLFRVVVGVKVADFRLRIFVEQHGDPVRHVVKQMPAGAFVDFWILFVQPKEHGAERVGGGVGQVIAWVRNVGRNFGDGSFFVGEQFGGEPLRLGFGLGVGGKIHKKMGPCACHAHGVGGGGQSSSGIITVMAGSGLSMSSGPHWAINFTSLAR